jgi:hypothetical protein
MLLCLVVACSRAAPSLTPVPAITAEIEAVPSAVPADPPAESPTTKPTIRPTNKPTNQPTVPSTGEPTLTPALTLTPSSTQTPRPSVAVWEQDIVLNTYGWQDALVDTTSDDAIYPYPRLDFDALAPPAPQTYRAVIIQNEYVQLVVVPALGGRILRWTDLVTGRQLFYANPVVKPTRWGYRGWWLATGGMEWAFPTEEHGLNEYRPWEYQRLWNGVRVWDTDDRSGMAVEVTIQLDAGRSTFSVTPRIVNPTDEAQPYQFWANAMLTISDGNVPAPGLTFVLPDDAVTVHSTGDGGLPGPGGQMTWPVHAGRDFSHYSEWRQYLGVFADPAAAGFAGAYDPDVDQGVVRVFPPATAMGVKIFCMGDLPSDLWTDDGSRYFELWGGRTPTFWDYWTLEPGASIIWTERWYPVSGIGGYDWANADVAIRLTPEGDSAEVAVAATRPLNGTVVLRRGGVEVQRWDATIAPGNPFSSPPLDEGAGEGEWGVQVLEGGSIITQMGP